MDQTRRGSGRTSAALRHAMHLAQDGPVCFVASTTEAARQLVESAKRVGNALVQQNLQARGALGDGVDVIRGRATGYCNVVFDHYVIEQHRDYLLKQIDILQAQVDDLSKQGHLL